MTTVLVIVLVIGAAVLISLVSAASDAAVGQVGKGIGRLVKASKPQGFVAVTISPASVRSQLVTAGVLSADGDELTTDAGVRVKLTEASLRGTQGFACSWAKGGANSDATSVLADVARAVQSVDPGARIVL